MQALELDQSALNGSFNINSRGSDRHTGKKVVSVVHLSFDPFEEGDDDILVTSLQ
jgi:hypothetical protein